MSIYRYMLIDEFGGACRKFVSKVEATPFLTSGTSLVTIPREPKPDLYQRALLLVGEAPF